MKLSHRWLSRYVDLSGLSDDEIAHGLTMLGFEVESVESTGFAPLPHVVVAEIISYEPHPDADKLSVCQVDAGEGELRQIICGAKNFRQNDRVIAALPGAVLPGDFKIEPRKMRGVESQGMLCSERELGLGEDHDGIAILTARPEIGTAIHEVFGADADTVFDLEITPNRPDVLSHLGMARELGAWFKREVKYPQVKGVVSGGEQPGAPFVSKLTVEQDAFCPHYRGYNLKGVAVAESPDWLKQSLSAIGLRPINNVVDVTNYVLHELGHPMHAFDAGKIRGGEILVRPATEGEKITTLDEKERTLTDAMSVIADPERALVVAGVMGSLDAEVDDATTDLFLEVAYFDPKQVRATSKALNLSSDSSYRYERGIDPKGAQFAAERAIDLLLEVAGGEVVGPTLVAGGPRITDREITLEADYVRKRLGFDVLDAEIAEALAAIELRVNPGESERGDKFFRVGVPSFRQDLKRPIDLVEEVIRVYGCERIPEGRVQAVGLVAEDAPIVQFNRRASALLVGKGFAEAMHYTLREASETTVWTSPADAAILDLANPLASDQSHLRPSLVPGLLDCLALNQARHNDPTRLFEVGRVFRAHQGKVLELQSVAAVMVAPTEKGWRDAAAPDFFAAQALALDVLRAAGVTVDAANLMPLTQAGVWHEGQAATFGKMQMGLILEVGLLDLAMCKRLAITGPVYAVSLVATPEFLARPGKRKQYTPFSAFPPSVKDLALVADASIPAGKVLRDLNKAATQATKGTGFALDALGLFDVYEGEGLAPGMRSLAFRLTFRSAERTLKDKEVNKAYDQIQTAVTKKGTYAVRG